MNEWIVTLSSVIGSSHVSSGTPCQDACSNLVSEDGKWLSVVLSDGAGTAKKSDIGSKVISNIFAKSLIELSQEFAVKKPGSWVSDFVVNEVLKARKELRYITGFDDLKDFHCTLVACLIGDDGGFLIQIGDGASFGGLSKDTVDGKIDLSNNVICSLPENGEYANETYFITENSWIKHLRITPIGKVDWVVLGTDGGTTLAMLDDKIPKPGFIIPVIKGLTNINNAEARATYLKNILSNPQADKLTGDDKTLCIAFRKNLVKAKKEFQFNNIVNQNSEIMKNKISDVTNKVSSSNLEIDLPSSNKLTKKSMIIKVIIKKRKIISLTFLLLLIVSAFSFFILKNNNDGPFSGVNENNISEIEEKHLTTKNGSDKLNCAVTDEIPTNKKETDKLGGADTDKEILTIKKGTDEFGRVANPDGMDK